MGVDVGHILVGRYRLDQVIGRGGYATVFLATDTTDKMRVAVKVVDRAVDPDARRRFELEARVLKRLEHRRCVGLRDSGLTPDNIPFMVMDFVEGVPLRNYEVGSRAAALRIAMDVASVLAAAHRIGLVHRDIKPANIQVGADGHATVLDFGIARMLGVEHVDITKTGVVIGTPGFMSPEQLRGRKDIGSPTDVYSLGVVMFELLAGRPPFAGDTALELGMAHLQLAPPELDEGPPELRKLVARMLAKEPAARPTSTMVVRELDLILTGPRHEAPPPNSDVRVRDPRVAIGLGALVGAIVVVFYLATVNTPEPRSPEPGPPMAPRPSARLPPAPAPKLEAPVAVSRATTPGVQKSAGCAAARDSAPGFRDSIMDGLQRRSVVQYVPPGYVSDEPRPLIVVFHDDRMSPMEAVEEWELVQLADEHNVLIMAPPGEGTNKWDHADDWARAMEDVGLIEDALCVDRGRVFGLGTGVGGKATDGIACEVPGRFAAVANIGQRLGPWDGRACRHEDAPPIARMTLAAVGDRQDPIEGGRPQAPCPGKYERRSFDDIVAFHVEHNGCEREAPPFAPVAGAACRTWSCEVPYQACLLEGGRFQQDRGNPRCHGKPGQRERRRLIWAFFSSISDAKEVPDVSLTY